MIYILRSIWRRDCWWQFWTENLFTGTTEYRPIFSDLGVDQNFEYENELNPEVLSVASSLRRLSPAILPQVSMVIDKLLEKNAIKLILRKLLFGVLQWLLLGRLIILSGYAPIWEIWAKRSSELLITFLQLTIFLRKWDDTKFSASLITKVLVIRFTSFKVHEYSQQFLTFTTPVGRFFWKQLRSLRYCIYGYTRVYLVLLRCFKCSSTELSKVYQKPTGTIRWHSRHCINCWRKQKGPQFGFWFTTSGKNDP